MNVLYVSYGSIGDFLMTLQVLSALHAAKPEWKITILTTRDVPLRQMTAAYPYIQVRSLAHGLLKLFAKNVFVIPFTFGTTTKRVRFMGRLLTRRAGSRLITFTRERSHARGNHLFFDLQSSYVKNLYRLLDLFSITHPDTLSFEYPKNPDFLRKQDLSNDSYIVVEPFAGNPVRSLPVSRWIGLLKELQSFYAGPVVFLGNPSSFDQMNTLIRDAGISNARNMCVDPPARDVADLIDHSKLFIGVDTGLTHLAGVLGKRSVIIGNNSNPTWRPTYNPNATILTHDEHCTCRGDKGGNCFVEVEGKKYYRCMIEIPDTEILAAIRGVL
jgi:ADP-heptose:LPS heptosyltransferase